MKPIPPLYTTLSHSLTIVATASCPTGQPPTHNVVIRWLIQHSQITLVGCWVFVYGCCFVYPERNPKRNLTVREHKFRMFYKVVSSQKSNIVFICQCLYSILNPLLLEPPNVCLCQMLSQTMIFHCSIANTTIKQQYHYQTVHFYFRYKRILFESN